MAHTSQAVLALGVHARSADRLNIHVPPSSNRVMRHIAPDT
ncbi:hypothetical protein CBM2625_B130012 [Cupriavidus taiwanensis]|uniref:Uncharacterized protein n=1 Tax=Cupriavidus taiwanensis TaxID=164546 RepID=A0A976B0L1_9BURK|nr:hypothetical protein CBM2613_B130012 [Cupriavidus taiwanensis]SPA08366.1 hypothetical protein CBM2625_B130012 [Cupriavidus taiwanensis]